MFYPNGTSTISDLVKYMKSDKFKIYLEDNRNKPEDWDWKEKGFYRGERTEITTMEQLMDAIEKDQTIEGVTICVDTTDAYFRDSSYPGEEQSYVKEVFEWQYTSLFGKKYSYRITESTYLSEKPKYVPLSLECFTEFNRCFTIGTWERDKEGYEFHSVGSRLFEYVDEKDVERIWNAIKKADEYLSERFETEKN